MLWRAIKLILTVVNGPRIQKNTQSLPSFCWYPWNQGSGQSQKEQVSKFGIQVPDSVSHAYELD